MSFAVTAAVAVGVAAAGTAASIVQGNKARKAQERASQVQSKIEARSAQRDRMQQLRQAQIARATAVQGAVTSGTADSSGTAGQLANIQSVAGGNLAFSQMTETGVGVINNFNRRAGRYASQASTYSAVAGLSLSVAGAAGGLQAPKASAPTS